jgi:hypothetical protein
LRVFLISSFSDWHFAVEFLESLMHCGGGPSKTQLPQISVSSQLLSSLDQLVVKNPQVNETTLSFKESPHASQSLQKASAENVDRPGANIFALLVDAACHTDNAMSIRPLPQDIKQDIRQANVPVIPPVRPTVRRI